MKQSIVLGIGIAAMTIPLASEIIPSPGTGVGYQVETKKEQKLDKYVRPIKNVTEDKTGPTTYTLIPTNWIKVK
tara:strand:+ start:472 stop:693 length:222 start_codon:yes stop_codon:yes gene_type:complete